MLVHGGPWHADHGLDGNFVRKSGDVGLVAEQPRVAGHVRAGRDLARVEEVVEMPVVSAFADAHELGVRGERTALVGEIGTGALGTPLVRVVEERFAEVRVVVRDAGAAVAHDVGDKRPDHLRVTVITAFGNVDVAACEFEWRVEFLKASLDVFLPVDDQGWDDLDGSTDGHGDEDQDGERHVVLDDAFMPVRPFLLRGPEGENGLDA